MIILAIDIVLHLVKKYPNILALKFEDFPVYTDILKNTAYTFSLLSLFFMFSSFWLNQHAKVDWGTFDKHWEI